MLNVDETELTHFRRVGATVEIPDEADVETALALPGSAAQSKIQTFPGDCDFFERVNIKAPTFEAACRRLGDITRKKAHTRAEGPRYKLMEVKFGEFPETLDDGDTTHPAGASISWTPEEVEEQEIVTMLLHLRADVTAGNSDPVAIEGARMALLNIVNNFFSEKLNAMPEVRDYISEVTEAETTPSES